MTLRLRKNRHNSLLRGIEKLECRLLLVGDLEFRSFDGSGNNVDNELWGAADTQLLRLTTEEYGAGNEGAFPALAPRADSAGDTINPRDVSNLLFDQDESVLNIRGLTSFIFQWGQFLDHDMDLTEDFAPVGAPELLGESIPFTTSDPDDELFDLFPDADEFVIPVLRSRFELDDEGVAQQINQITSYIDASNVYGSDGEKAEGLRAGFGGLLLTSDGVNNLADGSGEFLPFNYEVDGEFLENASPPTTGTGVPISESDLFIAGDIRSNEQPGLTTLHTLFVMEHNYQAGRIAEQLDLDDHLADPEVDEYVYQLARAVTSAEVQSITYNEFIPSLLGPDQLESYSGYQSDVNAGIANIFSASLYRVGHTMLPNELLLLDEEGDPVEDAEILGAIVDNGEVSLGDAFFNPQLITHYGIEPYLKGLAVQQIEEIDNLIVDGVRNVLFDPPAATDLGATNLQRGRDHGLADYNRTRVDFGLDPVTSFSQISSDPSVVAALEAAYDADNDGVNDYDAINNIDVFAGAISEDHVAGSSLGELIQTVLVDQFTRLRDGDRFYYENVFAGSKLNEIQNTRLSDIIRRNTDLQDVQDEVFRTENVLTYRAPEGSGRANVTLRVQDDQLQVVRGFGSPVLASQDLADTDIVVIYGTSRNDTIRIDGSVAESFAGSVELHGGGGNVDRLVVRGTNSDDQIEVFDTAITVNEDLSLFYGNFERLTVQTRGGNDLASVGGPVSVSLSLAGGAGNDILVGGNGDDLLSGGRGRDILVGDSGSDWLFGNRGEDIVVAGTTDNDLDDLAAVLAVWADESISYADRVDMLSGLISSQDDDAVDFLFGGLNRDWFLLDADDLAVDRFFGEAVN